MNVYRFSGNIFFQSELIGPEYQLGPDWVSQHKITYGLVSVQGWQLNAGKINNERKT